MRLKSTKKSGSDASWKSDVELAKTMSMKALLRASTQMIFKLIRL